MKGEKSTVFLADLQLKSKILLNLDKRHEKDIGLQAFGGNGREAVLRGTWKIGLDIQKGC